jgi:hypothetical protein
MNVEKFYNSPTIQAMSFYFLEKSLTGGKCGMIVETEWYFIKKKVPLDERDQFYLKKNDNPYTSMRSGSSR